MWPESYTAELNQFCAMLPLVLHIPLEQLSLRNTVPLTRKGVIELARSATGGLSREVHFAVTVPDIEDGFVLKLATVELNVTDAGAWWLQYVSHPAQSFGLTKLIRPRRTDLVVFLQARKVMGVPKAFRPFCAQEMEAEGLGPLDALNLRVRNPAPVVPSRKDLAMLRSLAKLAPSH